MPAFTDRLDIVNRALQHCRRNRIFTLTDQSPQAEEARFVYDKVRDAELRGNIWRFAIRRSVLRPVDTLIAVLTTNAQTTSGLTLPFSDTTGVVVGQLVTGTNIAAGTTVADFVENVSVTLSIAITGTVASAASITFGPLTFLWVPPVYAAATTYLVGQVVSYLGDWWQSKVTANIANTPAPSAYWTRYCGVDTMEAWDTDTSYYPGELALASSGAVYMSLRSQASHNPVSTAGFWRIVNGTVIGLSILYPIGTGPRSDSQTNNVFRLPYGFLRQAPSDPKAGLNPFLGAPAGPIADDWLLEGNYIISSDTRALLRYVADVVDVADMDPMFCEMVAARVGEELAPMLADENVLNVILANTARHYKTERYKAVVVNGIETGPVEPVEDDFITCRY